MLGAVFRDVLPRVTLPGELVPSRADHSSVFIRARRYDRPAYMLILIVDGLDYQSI